jgi:hypothetical protein
MEQCKPYLFKKEDFFLDNPYVLYKNSNYLKFFPKYDTTRTEQLNAIIRLCIYFVILIIIFNANYQWLYLPIIVSIIVIILYNISIFDVQHKVKELEKISDVRKQEYVNKVSINEEELKHDGDKNIKLDIEPEELQKNYELEAGIIDSTGKLHIGKEYDVNCKNCPSQTDFYTIAELEEYKRNTCKRPTIDNPYMNTNIYDFNNGHVPVACNVDDDDIKEDIKVNFNHNLFRNVDELWERENSQRQFYTMPNTTVPNNQVEFAKWLYKIPENCKETNQNGECLRYDDLRYQRR